MSVHIDDGNAVLSCQKQYSPPKTNHLKAEKLPVEPVFKKCEIFRKVIRNFRYRGRRGFSESYRKLVLSPCIGPNGTNKAVESPNKEANGR